MTARKTTPQRLGRVLEAVTRQSGRLAETPAYGSWLLGRVTESPRRQRVRIQAVMTALIVTGNLIGVGVAALLLTVAFPVPSVFADAPFWLTFTVAPAYVAAAVALGTFWITRQTVRNLRRATERRRPTRVDQRSTIVTPWRVAAIHLILWGVGTALLTTLYGSVTRQFIPQVLFSVGIVGLITATFSYLVTEFALRPVPTRALEAGAPPRRLAPGLMGREMTVWLLGCGLPVVGIIATVLVAGRTAGADRAQRPVPTVALLCHPAPADRARP